MKYVLIIAFALTANMLLAQDKDEAAIRQILSNQTQAWNSGDINRFMQGYWENDSLVFIGKSGPKYGYNTTLANYKKGYPDTTAMGKLNFTLLEIRKLSPRYYFVIGKWHLTRSIGNLSGHYTLLFENIKGEWKIVADHSS